MLQRNGDGDGLYGSSPGGWIAPATESTVARGDVLARRSIHSWHVGRLQSVVVNSTHTPAEIVCMLYTLLVRGRTQINVGKLPR